jgi:hypothetical protein
MNPADHQYGTGGLPFTGFPVVYVAAIGLVLIVAGILFRMWRNSQYPEG